MKFFLLDLKSYYKKGAALLKLIALILLFVAASKISTEVYASSEKYKATLSDVTEKSTIILDAGHGGEHCGAIGVNGVYEKDLNLTIANELGKMLKGKPLQLVNDLINASDEIVAITRIENFKLGFRLGVQMICDSLICDDSIFKDL